MNDTFIQIELTKKEARVVQKLIQEAFKHYCMAKVVDGNAVTLARVLDLLEKQQ